MASIYGVSLKNFKKINGYEGDGFSASIYIDGKHAGSYVDAGDGGIGYDIFDSEELEKKFVKVMVAVGKNRPNPYLEKLYEERPEQLKEDTERFKSAYPYIPEEDITIRTICNDSIDCFIGLLADLLGREKCYKKIVKQGFSVLCMDDKGAGFCYGYNGKEVPDEVKSKYQECYSSLDDFNIDNAHPLQIAVPN